MKKLLAFTILLIQPLMAAPEDSLVRINSTIQKYNPSQPWEKTPPAKRRGLGALLSGNRILTTAAMAADSIYIELQSADSTQTIPAKVATVDYGANLAILVPDDEAGFLSTLKPTELTTTMPKLGDAVDLLQLENNGDPLSTTGHVRSMKIISTFVNGRYFLAYDIKASMQTSGNSYTLPAYHKGKLSGILTSYNSNDQLSEVISADIIGAFLKDAADGEYAGFPSLGLGTTTTEDPHFRGWLKLPEDKGGLYVTRVRPGSSGEVSGILKGDVILSISGHELDRRGFFNHPEYGTLFWPHLVTGLPVMGETVPVEILREGNTQTVLVTLTKAPTPLVPVHNYDIAPSFLIKGGLVFQELSRPYLQAFGKEWANRAPLNLLDVLSNPEDYEEGRRRVVVLTRVVATEATIGYDRLNSQIVESINGQPIAGLPELVEAFTKAPENGIHTIQTDAEPYQIFLDENLSKKVDQDFLQRGLPILQRLYKVAKVVQPAPEIKEAVEKAEKKSGKKRKKGKKGKKDKSEPKAKPGKKINQPSVK